MEDQNNYSYEGSIDLESVDTAEATDLDICWGNLTSDIQCHEVDPAEDIDNVSIIRFPYLSQEEIEEGLSNNSLLQADMDGYLEYGNDGGTCTTLSSLSFFGTPVDIEKEYTEAGGTYLMLFTSGTVPGVGARSLIFLAPSPEETNTFVDVPSGCGAIDFTVELDTLEPVEICRDGPWVVDWSGLTTDGIGNDIDLGGIDKVMIGYYEDFTIGEIEVQFFDLEMISTSLYEIDFEGGNSVDLGEATGEAGNFSGFEGDGIWLLALRCGRCYNPAPLFLTILEPMDGGE